MRPSGRGIVVDGGRVAALQPVPGQFFERARREAERYGDDPFVFLRELVQNARDAGATRVEFTTSDGDQREVVTCADDGSGMSKEDVVRFLLRLYSSSKGAGSPGKAGCFGVGFWSILRFEPDTVRVDSHDGEGAVAFEVDPARETVVEIAAQRTTRGTTIRLARRARAVRLREQVRSTVSLTCGPIAGLEGRAAPALFVDGAQANRAIAPLPLFGARVKGKGFFGAVSLGEKPSVRLYSHGLLVRATTTLEELVPTRGLGRLTSVPGLHPVVEIDADGLVVLMDRQAVAEDELLFDIVTTCRTRLLRLQRRIVDDLAPLSPLDRLLSALPALAAIALVAGASAAAWTTTLPGHGADLLAPASAPRLLEGALPPDRGPRIDAAEARGARSWQVGFSGPPFVLLRIATYARFDDAAGLLLDPARVAAPYPRPELAAGAMPTDVVVELGERGGVIELPVPVGAAIDPASLRLDDAPAPIAMSQHGTPVLALPIGPPRTATYRAQPMSAPLPVPTPAVSDAPTELPADAAALVAAVRPLPYDEKVAALARFVAARVRYTTDSDEAAAFDEARGAFVARVLQAGVGDCDVMNATFALLLRAAGVPARVAVGLVGQDGRIADTLHAWTEAWDGKEWRSVDVSPALSRARRGGEVPVRELVEDPAPPPATAATAATATEAEATAAVARSAARDAAQVRLRVAGGVLIAALVVLVLALWRVLVAKSPNDVVRRARPALIALFHHQLQHGGPDPLRIRRRPFLPTRQGAEVSLDDAARAAARGRLFVATGGSWLADSLAGAVVLDADDARVRALAPDVPELVALQDVEAMLARAQPTPVVASFTARLRALDPRARCFAVTGDVEITELDLPIPDSDELGGRIVIIGLDDPAVAGAVAAFADAPALATFRLAARVLGATTIFRRHERALLATLAAEALA